METKEGLMLAVIFLLIAAIISIPNTYAATHTHTPKTTSSPPISGLTTNTPSSNTPSTPSSNTPSQPTTPPPQQQPNVKVKVGQLNEQNCVGVQSIFERNLNVNNIHKTTIREGGSTVVVVGQPATTASGATPVILYIQGVGYVEVTGIQAAGGGQATITYVVLVPAK